MKRIMSFLILFVLGSSILAQDYRLQLQSRWRDGPCLTVAYSPNTWGIFISNGGQIDILETPFLHPYPERIITRGVAHKIILKDSILFALIGEKGFGVYGNFYTPQGKEWFFQKFDEELRDMILVDSTLFISADQNLWVVGVAQPTSPRIVDKFGYLGYEMAVKDSLLFIGKYILNISSPYHPVLLDTLPAGYYGPANPFKMEINGNFLYAIMRSEPPVWDNFYVYDISNPLNIHLISELPLPGDWSSHGYSLAVSDTMAFVGYGSDTGHGLLGIEIKDPYHPEIITNQYFGIPLDLQLVDSVLLAASGSDGFFKIDVSDPWHLKTISNHHTAGSSYHVFARGDKVYISTLKELNILNMSDVDQPRFISSIRSIPDDWSIEPGHRFSAAAAYVSKDEKSLYLMDYAHGLFEFKASDSLNGSGWSNPTGFLKSYLGINYAVDEKRDLLFATHQWNGFTTFDLKNWQKYPGNLSGYGLDIAFEDTLLAVAINNKGIDFYNYKDAENPQWFFHTDFRQICALSIHNSYLFVGEYDASKQTSTLSIFQLNSAFFSLSTPIRYLFFEFKGQITDIEVFDENTIFVSDAQFGLRQFKFQNLDTLYQEATYPTEGMAQAMYIFSPKNLWPYYLLLADGEDGLYVYEITNLIGIENKRENLPDKFQLQQNYPNPFNLQTVIPYELAKSADVRLTIFNLKGQKVREWYFKNQAPGQHRIKFNAGQLSSGIYFYRLQTNSGIVQSRKMVLLK